MNIFIGITIVVTIALIGYASTKKKKVVEAIEEAKVNFDNLIDESSDDGAKLADGVKKTHIVMIKTVDYYKHMIKYNLRYVQLLELRTLAENYETEFEDMMRCFIEYNNFKRIPLWFIMKYPKLRLNGYYVFNNISEFGAGTRATS